MAKFKKRTRTSSYDKSKFNKNILVIIAILIMLIGIPAGGYYYLRIMPEVSRADAEILLEEYRTNITGLYERLETAYEEIDEEETDKWEEFSREWVPENVKSRPSDLNKRLREADENEKQKLMIADGSLLDLWTEYNRKYEGRSVREDSVNQLKSRIENAIN